MYRCPSDTTANIKINFVLREGADSNSSARNSRSHRSTGFLV